MVRKQMIINRNNYIDQVTGEIIETLVVEKEVHSDYNFHKVFMTDLLEIMNNFGNKKIKIFSFLLSEMRNEDNSVSVTQRYICQKTNISRPTVSRTIKELRDMDIISYHKGKRTYYINPKILVRGSGNKRQNLLIKYKEIENDFDSDDLIYEENKLLEIENKY